MKTFNLNAANAVQQTLWRGMNARQWLSITRRRAAMGIFVRIALSVATLALAAKLAF